MKSYKTDIDLHFYTIHGDILNDNLDLTTIYNRNLVMAPKVTSFLEKKDDTS